MLEHYQDALLFELQGADDFLMALPAEDRASWDGLSAETRASVTARANGWLEKPVPALSASSYLSFSRAGVAAEYAAARQTRRNMLRDLVLGSCVTPDGRYDLKLADVIWAICEESSWILPPNNPAALSGLPLPDITEPKIDAAAAETAADLAMAVQMACARLNAVSPQLVERIDHEISRRVIRPFLTLRDLNWLCGPKSDALRALTGCTLAFLTFERDDRRRWQCMRKAWTLFDQLLSRLPADGSVPGGVEEWLAATEPVMDMVMTVLSVSRGQVDARREKQIQLMCHYPVFCHMAQGWFVSPGTHSMRPALNGRAMYRLGVYAEDEALCDLGAFLCRTQETPDPAQSLLHASADLFNRDALAAEPIRPPFRRQGYYGVCQLMVARHDEDSERGLALAVHGGHNGAVGAHPDAGDFLLFAEGQPVLIDDGFSGNHNLPIVADMEEGLGASYRVEDAACRLEDDYAMLSMNLAPAYPAQAGLYDWQRTLIYERGTGVVQLIDMFDLQSPAPVLFCFTTPFEPTLGERFAQLGPVRMRWEAGLTADSVEFPVPEGDLRALWGEKLYRVILSAPEPLKNGKFTFTFNALRTFG